MAVSVILYGCTTWTNKTLGKKLDKDDTRILCAVLHESWKQYLTKQQLYGHLPFISQIIKVRWTRPVREVRMNSQARSSNSLLHMNTPQCWITSKNLHSLGVQILDSIQRTYQEWWLIGQMVRERERVKRINVGVCHDGYDILIFLV